MDVRCPSFHRGFCRVRVASCGCGCCTVPIFRQKFALEDAIGSHACSLEANMCVTNGIPLGSPLLLPAGIVNHVTPLKVLATRPNSGRWLSANHKLCHATEGPCNKTKQWEVGKISTLHHCPTNDQGDSTCPGQVALFGNGVMGNMGCGDLPSSLSSS
jgi:hypothetical protein